MIVQKNRKGKYTIDMNYKNIEIVIDLLKENNIKNIVISPGGTNIPFVKAVQDDDFFSCYSVVDERSAMYFAIGLYLQSGECVVTSCTSAQATRNYIPGLTEAYYKKVPVLAITMEKHPRFKYQEYMQAPDQTSLPIDCVKKSYELPFINDYNDVLHSIRVTNQAIQDLTFNGYGPVQLAIPWLDFPKENVNPLFRVIKRFRADSVLPKDLEGKKILLIVGEHRPFDRYEATLINAFCASYNVVVYKNHLSNIHNSYTVNGNLLLSSLKEDEFRYLKPDIVITIGGQTGDYPLYHAISNPSLDNVEHWRISEDGGIVDTYDKLTRVYYGKVSDFFSALQVERSSSHSYFTLWDQEIGRLNTEIPVPFSAVAVAQYLHNKIPQNSIVQFAILNSLRVWELFPLDSSITCYSNVGAFGIDGGLSTLIGQSVLTDELSFMITGDLAFYYDMNSIGIRHIKNNLRILLVNNNGGFEFKLSNNDTNNVNRYIAAADHFKNAEGWAKTCGFVYLNAHNMEEFKSNVKTFIDVSNQPILFEVFVSDDDERAAYQRIINENKKKNAVDTVKKGIKRIIGQNATAHIKAFAKERNKI